MTKLTDTTNKQMDRQVIKGLREKQTVYWLSYQLMAVWPVGLTDEWTD